MEERKNRVIISVSRQFGSGGHKIAEALAEHFELPIYDHRMLDSIAKEKGVDPRVLEKYDEKPLNRFLARNVSGFSSSLENNLAQMQFSYLKDKADSGESFVVVGRCAETVLKEYDGLITLFVLGDEETRVKRIEQMHGLSEDEAKRLVKTKDWRRKSYHNCYSRGRWGDSRNYDLSINSSRLGIEGTTKMLEEYVQARMDAMQK